jgi:hypothetical protein
MAPGRRETRLTTGWTGICRDRTDRVERLTMRSAGSCRTSAELSNIAVVLVAAFTTVIRRPFTLEYARERADPEDLDSPVFIRVNYVLS